MYTIIYLGLKYFTMTHLHNYFDKHVSLYFRLSFLPSQIFNFVESKDVTKKVVSYASVKKKMPWGHPSTLWVLGDHLIVG